MGINLVGEIMTDKNKKMTREEFLNLTPEERNNLGAERLINEVIPLAREVLNQRKVDKELLKRLERLKKELKNAEQNLSKKQIREVELKIKRIEQQLKE
tara:strand:+ start:232 stop:528 length:297 start_codon:yes stop_codon:yes gene_type:complete